MRELLICFAEEIMIYILLINVLPWSDIKKKYQIGGVFILTAAGSIMSLSNRDSTIYILLILSMHIIYAYTCFEGKKPERVLWGAYYSIITVIAGEITFLITEILNDHKLFLSLPTVIIKYMMEVNYIVLLVIIVLVVIKLRKNKLFLPMKYQIILLVIIMGCLLVFKELSKLFLLAKGMDGAYALRKLIDIICVLLIMIISFSTYTVVGMARVYCERDQLRDTKLRLDYEQKAFEAIQNNIHTLRVWKHEFKNHLQVIRTLMNGKEKEATAYLDMISVEFEQSTAFVNCGDMVIDSVISSKIVEAQKHNISFEHKIYMDGGLSLNEMQKASLFGNLLDNAIEASDYVEEHERFIKFTIKSFKDNILIMVENCYDGTCLYEMNDIKSRKESGEHGYGLKLIKQIVEEANGTMLIEQQDHLFRITIMISSGEETE